MLPSRPVDAAASHSRSPEPSLAVDGLCCLRGDRVLFEDLGFALAPGGVVQLEGPNGSGKTTLLRAICGLTPFETGTIYWRGTPRDEIIDDFRAALTYIGHVPGVKRDLTAREDLMAWRALGAGESTCAADIAFERAGVAGLGDTPLRHLSAGQTRRVALARLIAMPTMLWLLDEPLTALDTDGKVLLETLLSEHATAGGMTVISTHHQLDLADIPVQRIRLGD